jgi:hypothetical protein
MAAIGTAPKLCSSASAAAPLDRAYVTTIRAVGSAGVALPLEAKPAQASPAKAGQNHVRALMSAWWPTPAETCAQVFRSRGPSPDMSHKSASLLQLGVAIAVALALTFVLAARTASTPILNLGPIAVADDIATVSGTLSSQTTAETLSVNGQPIGVDAAGHFAGSVRVDGASALDLQLRSAGGAQTVSFEVPLALLGQGGVIPAGVLDSLTQAGVSLLTPVLSGNGLTVTGGMLDKGQLAGLSVNGQDVLDKLEHDGSFSLQLPGTTKVVTLKIVDKQGVTETRTTRLKEQRVSAARAVGVRIAKVRFFTRSAVRFHRVRMVVTVKDRLGRLIRGARVSASAKARRLAYKPKPTLSGRKGKATLVLRVRTPALGKRLVVVVVAKTPKSKARRTSSVGLPRGGHR